MADTARLSLNAFLSHRYRSPEINIYFYNLFSQRADVYFDADLGTVATNVTRLERMIRSCDAFIGIYPYPGEAMVAPSHDEKMAASRYFRLELDLAIRSRTPALVFYDRHYACVLTLVQTARPCSGLAGDVTRPPCDPSDNQEQGHEGDDGGRTLECAPIRAARLP